MFITVKTDHCGITAPAHCINEENGVAYLESHATGNYVMF